MTDPSEKKLTFEQALAQLEKIVAQVEQGDVPLEKTIEKYEQGMKLIQHCRAILEQAEKKIELINQASNPPTDQTPETPDENNLD